MVFDAHRHIGVLPAHPFYGGPPVNPDTTARGTVKQLLADLDAEGTERALVIPNYGVPDPDAAFRLNDLVLEAAQADDRVRAGLWVSPRPADAERTAKALALAGEPGVRALKLSFLLGGRPTDPDCRAPLDAIFAAAERYGLVVHVHTSPGAASDIDEVGHLVEWYADRVPVHLVHFGGGMSGHIKLAGGRFFDWIAAGKRVYTDLSWAIGFAPRWLAAEIERRGLGHDRVLFASDQPWGDYAGEHARTAAALAGSELQARVFRDTFAALYD
ncbi:amidohydrolase family protein [Actinacidiphila guanduensis]|jgi:predicted TIM-barrel fold metal-dependent hydrolase|uniref:Predicted metal-dependent hydrolase, TIM-barrel fold n=1 Tax=Actinacidiphila guanduensis TaxID=310781 RepID=A0A1G9ZRA3_9ACTN|nr:amidohydrolase family protein [Actinacidiphila guanduensis]SDN23491.1 Predicted metal-dependent hydrolase, TIM-barrel fold [Actinacidiphila guanduensis]